MAKDRGMRDAGVGVSKADLDRGYTRETDYENLGVPSADARPIFTLSPAGLNPERFDYDPERRRFYDRYAGGFLPRDGYSTER